MKVLFYSDQCKYSKELIKQLKETSFIKEFNIVNVDKTTVPKQIKVVPTIIDSNYKDMLEGKKAFEYLFNKKYFNISTNNLFLWKDKNLPVLEIKEDKLAITTNTDLIDSLNFDNNLEKNNDNKNEPEKKNKVIISKRNLFLLRGKTR